MLPRSLVGRRGQRHVLHFLRQLRAMGHVVLHELLHFGFAERLGTDVDEDRAGERGIGALGDRFEGGRYRLTLLVDDRHCPQLVLVLDVIGEAEVAQRVGVARDALHQHVVVLRGGEVAARGLRLADHRLGEVIEGARIGARPEEIHRPVGPRRVDLGPAHHLALGGWLPHLLQFRDRQLLEERVLRIDHHGEGVEGYRQFVEPDPGRLAIVHFLLGDRPRGAGHVDLVAAEFLEAAAGARNADRHADGALFQFLEILGHGFGNRKHGARAVDLDDLGMRGCCGRQRDGQQDGYHRNSLAIFHAAQHKGAVLPHHDYLQPT